MQQPTDSSQSMLLTLHDAITDSPVYRSSTLHFDEQLDLLEKWLELLSKYMKQYVDKLNKFNLETNILCKKVIPVGIDVSTIDPNFTGAVIKSFSDALQTSLAFKTKLVSDLEDNFIQPLQLFVKTHLREFKDFRRQHEKTLEKYEAQLAKYTGQSKTKEASAVREEAFRLYEARKSYARMSGQHVVRILHFRSILEHFLVERFSLATAFHLKEFEGGSDSWSKLQSSLSAWKQWLVDDKDTCNYQLHQLQTSRTALENKYLAVTRPARDLDKYAPTNATQIGLSNRHSLDYSTLNSNNQPSHKWGYLFIRGARGYWIRRWFFLYDGCFGSCTINSSPRQKGTISMGDRVSVLLCDIKPIADIDRRFCFEVMCAHQPSFVLQAETEEEMREWMATFEKAKRLMLQTEQLDYKKSGTATNLPSNTASNSTVTLVTNTTSDAETITPTTTTTSPTALLDNTLSKSKATTSVDELPALSINQTTKSDTASSSDVETPSIVMLSTSAENDPNSLTQSTSLTPLLVWEASRASMGMNATNGATSTPSSPMTQSFSAAAISLDATLNQHNEKENASSSTSTTTNNNNTTATTAATQSTTTSSSWGIPWALVPSMFQGGSSDDISSELPPTPGASPNVLPAMTDSEGHQVIWPTRVDDSNVPKVDLVGYPVWLDTRNKELRQLFGGVGQNEVVLSAFIGLLKKKPLHSPPELKEIEIPTSPTVANTPMESLESELSAQLPSTVKDPSSNYGYAYTGRGFITQETFWFYSCVLMTCVNTVAIRLRDIKSIRLIRDSSIVNDGSSSNLALAIDLASSSGTNDAQSPLIFTTLMDDIEVIAEKLRFAVDNSKSPEPAPLQMTYDVIHSLSAAVNKNKSASSQVKTIITSSSSSSTSHLSSVEPVRSSSDITSKGTLRASSSTSSLLEPMPTSNKKKSKTPRKHSAPVQPKSGALAAAMMAATVAGGSGIFDARKGMAQDNLLRNKKSKATFEDGDVPLPNSTISSANSSVVNVPSKLSDITTLDTSAPAATATAAPAADPHAPPEGFKEPSGPVSCGCDNHYDKVEAEIEVPISAKHLYYILFSEENPNYKDIWEKKTTENNSKDLTMTSWGPVDGKQERTLKYIIPVNNAMVKLKEAEVVEKQVLEKKEDYLRYVILTSTKAAQLPYADAFVPYVKYCITWVSKDRCKLTCYAGVKFLKNILVKGIVSKAAMKGISDNMAIFMPIIKNEANKVTTTHRKRSGSKEKMDQVTLKRMGTIRRPSSKNLDEESNKEATASGGGGWYEQAEAMMETVRDIVEAIPFIAKVGVAAVLVLWLLFSWFRAAGSRRGGATAPSSNTHIVDVHQPPVVASRAVYLRDINEGLLHADTTPVYGHSESFRLFLESKVTNRTIGTNHRWYSAQHHQFAVELLFSRERLAMLRHDTLILFQLVNEVDQQLLENEYVNWLMDTRLQCKSPDADYTGLHCDDIKRQLRAFPIDSYHHS